MARRIKMINADIFKSYLKDGMSLMVGGFMGVGTPELLVDAIIESGVKDLTLICNDTAFTTKGVGKLIVSKQISHVIASHIGTNPETGRQMINGEVKVTLVPQGTLVERIRSAGAGLGGVLTPTGLGTVVEDNKKLVEVGGKNWILEEPLSADMALLHANKADNYGNLFFAKSSKNFNTVMATSGKYVFAQVDEIVEGALDPEIVSTPGVFVDYMIDGSR